MSGQNLDDNSILFGLSGLEKRRRNTLQAWTHDAKEEIGKQDECAESHAKR